VQKAFFIRRLNDHIQYMKKINATLLGEGDFYGTQHTECKLGQWLYGEGVAEVKALNSGKAKTIFDSIIEPHQRFHLVSKKALECKANGDEEGSQAAVTEMHVLSNTISQKLLELDDISLKC
jgi:hypothetical protein